MNNSPVQYQGEQEKDPYTYIRERAYQEWTAIFLGMKQKTAGYVVLGSTWSILMIAIVSYLYVSCNSTALYYWCWVWLCPFMVWNWVTIAWCDSELFANSKRRLVS